MFDKRPPSVKESLDIAANMIKAGEIARGKAILESLLRTESDNVLALLWMTRCVSSPEEKLTYFRRVLEIDPSNKFALQGIGIFQPRCPHPVRTPSVAAPAPAPPPPTASPPSTSAPVPAPPPPTASAPGLARKHKGLRLLALAAIAFTALCVVLPLSLSLIIVGSEGPSQSAAASPMPPPNSSPQPTRDPRTWVVYEVISDGRYDMSDLNHLVHSVSLTWENNTGGTNQESLFGTIPFRQGYTMHTGDFAYISAQNGDVLYGSLVCRIYLADGEGVHCLVDEGRQCGVLNEWRHGECSGDFCICTASGLVGYD